MLRAAGDDTAGAGEAEIVLVDVDGLGDELAAIRRRPTGGVAGWWPIGALLARALAEHRVREAEEAGESASMKAGILPPYRDQQQLVQDILNESGASPQIEVGTSHRFQGREFDTVIFDLVEDGKGWVAQGDLAGTKWQAAGLRLFNVGITRAQRRLYLIANAATIHRAQSGPLLAVRQLLDAGRIQVVSAAEVLGTPETPEDDPVVSEIWHALRDQATLIDLFDEDHLPDELCRRIDAAQERIWLWSPWVGRRSEQLLPHLSAAEARGVRVHPIVLPRDQVNLHLEARHEELATQIAGTVLAVHRRRRRRRRAMRLAPAVPRRAGNAEPTAPQPGHVTPSRAPGSVKHGTVLDDGFDFHQPGSGMRPRLFGQQVPGRAPQRHVAVRRGDNGDARYALVGQGLADRRGEDRQRSADVAADNEQLRLEAQQDRRQATADGGAHLLVGLDRRLAAAGGQVSYLSGAGSTGQPARD